MKFRNLLIALVVALGLGAYVYFIEIQGEEKRQKDKDASERVLRVTKDDIASVTLDSRGSRVSLAREGEEWKIREPVVTAPDREAVDRLLDALPDIRTTRELGEVADLSAYQLENPPLRVKIGTSSSKTPPSLSVGDDAPTGGGAYARLDDSKKVLLVSGAESLRNTTLFGLRDKTLIHFDPSQLASCRIVQGNQTIALSRVDGKWRLTEPVLAPADDPAVSDLLYALERLSAQEFVDENPSAAVRKEHGLEPPRFRIALSGEEWSGEKAVEFGKPAGGSMVAIRPDSGELVKVPDSLEAKLKDPIASFRKKDVLPVGRFEVERFRIAGLTPKPLLLERKDDTHWERLSPAQTVLEDESVDLLLRNLTDLKAENFVDSPRPDLFRFGLDRPTVKMEFWKKASGEEAPAVVEVGREVGSGNVAMRDPAWPSVLLVGGGPWTTAREQIRKLAGETGKSEKPAIEGAPASEGASEKTQTSP